MKVPEYGDDVFQIPTGVQPGVCVALREVVQSNAMHELLADFNRCSIVLHPLKVAFVDQLLATHERLAAGKTERRFEVDPVSFSSTVAALNDPAVANIQIHILQLVLI